jgi:hypothetical protein
MGYRSGPPRGLTRPRRGAVGGVRLGRGLHVREIHLRFLTAGGETVPARAIPRCMNKYGRHRSRIRSRRDDRLLQQKYCCCIVAGISMFSRYSCDDGDFPLIKFAKYNQ